MKAPAWKGDWPLTAGERYSSGTYHGSWDIGMPIGTPVYAPRGGHILDTNDGVSNDTPGDADYSGEPSNWILFGFRTRWLRRKRTLYFQHLSPGLRVKRGEKVAAGRTLGKSGDSGNSSGAHLHLTLMAGWATEWNRYNYLTDGSAIYPPSKAWTGLRERKGKR